MNLLILLDFWRGGDNPPPLRQHKRLCQLLAPEEPEGIGRGPQRKLSLQGDAIRGQPGPGQRHPLHLLIMFEAGGPARLLYAGLVQADDGTRPRFDLPMAVVQRSAPPLRNLRLRHL